MRREIVFVSLLALTMVWPAFAPAQSLSLALVPNSKVSQIVEVRLQPLTCLSVCFSRHTYIRNIEKGKREKKSWYQYIFFGERTASIEVMRPQ